MLKRNYKLKVKKNFQEKIVKNVILHGTHTQSPLFKLVQQFKNESPVILKKKILTQNSKLNLFCKI